MARHLIVHAHPRPADSIVTAGLLAQLAGQPDTAVRSLYDLYPDFDIDVQAEQQALQEAEWVVWLSPVYWYTVPGLLKHWFDTVLTHGWAYGEGGTALQGKTAWWVASAGAALSDYSASGQHGRPLHEFTPVVEQVARYCGMRWHQPFVVHAGHHTSPHEMAQHHAALLAQWRELTATTGARP